jgi:hypothetical protein
MDLGRGPTEPTPAILCITILPAFYNHFFLRGSNIMPQISWMSGGIALKLTPIEQARNFTSKLYRFFFATHKKIDIIKKYFLEKNLSWDFFHHFGKSTFSRSKIQNIRFFFETLIFFRTTFFWYPKKYFFEVEKKYFGYISRRKNPSPFEWRGFQSDSGTPSWCLSNLIQPKSRKTIKSRLRSFSKTSRFNNSETYCSIHYRIRPIWSQ